MDVGRVFYLFDCGTGLVRAVIDDLVDAMNLTLNLKWLHAKQLYIF